MNDGVVKLRMFSESRGYGTIWLDPDGLIKISYFWVTFSSSDSNQFNVHTSNGGSALGVRKTTQLASAFDTPRTYHLDLH